MTDIERRLEISLRQLDQEEPPDRLDAIRRRANRQRRGYAVVASLAVVLLAASVPVLLTKVSDNKRPDSPVGVDPSPSVSDDANASCMTEPPPLLGKGETFRPAGSYTEGDDRVLPVVFPDGSTAELVYPSSLALHRMVVGPDTTGGTGRIIRPQISHGGVSFHAAEVSRCVESAQGKPVPIWRSKRGREVLALRYGDWYVTVFGGSQRLDAWAKHLRGDVTRGWLVLRGGGPLKIGPEQNPADSSLSFFGGEGFLSLWPLDCSRSGDESRTGVIEAGGRFTSFCVSNVEVHAQGHPDYVQAVATGVSVRNLETSFPIDHYEIVP